MSGPNSPERVTFAYTIEDQDHSIVFDASLNEQHGGQAQVSEHPVEKGPNITDNIRPMPRKLSLEAMVSNTPIYPLRLSPNDTSGGDAKTSFDSVTINRPLGAPIITQKYTALGFEEQFDRVKDVYGALVIAYQAGALIQVVTTLQTYDNMAIVNLSVPRNAESSNAVRFTIDMQELILVESLQVETLAAAHQEKKRGQTPNKEPEHKKEEVSRSLAKSLVNAITGAH